MREGLSYDDVMLVPQLGELEKREHADISTKIGHYTLEVPIISANMPSVTGPKMVHAMNLAGGLGVLHRFNTQAQAAQDFYECDGDKKGISIGIKDGLKRAQYFAELGGRHFFLDVAHGDHFQVYRFIEKFRKRMAGYDVIIIAGNIATRSAARSMCHAGVHGVKVGIGPGAACITREVTGFGIPQWTAVRDVAETLEDDGTGVQLIADGGIKTSGDIVKALAAGADAVMVGRLLAGCDEAPDPGVYYGNASAHLNDHNAPEGVYGQVERIGSVAQVMKSLAWGIKSGVSYGGVSNLAELRENAEWIRVTSYTAAESGIRL